MADSVLEHVNITVSDPKATAERLCKLFNWSVRWHGPAINGGTTYHVGSPDTYLAVFSQGERGAPVAGESYGIVGAMNHVGIVVPDYEATEQRVKDAGYHIHQYADYEPGRRFYYRDEDGIEFEVVSYD